MKRSRFSEAQIIGILKEHQAGMSAPDLCRKHGISDATFLQLATQVRRHGSGRREAAEGARGREREAEEDAGRADDGRRHTERDARKKLLRPGSRREAVDWAMKDKSYSQRRACKLAGIDPRVYRRTSKRPADTVLQTKMKELASAVNPGPKWGHWPT